MMPRVVRILFCSSSVSIPPIPLPMITPQRYRSVCPKSIPESFTALIDAAMPNWPKRSSRFGFSRSVLYLETSYFVRSKCVHSPPKRVGNADASHRLIGPIPLFPAHSASHISSTRSLSDVTTPKPDKTTRRLLICWNVL